MKTKKSSLWYGENLNILRICYIDGKVEVFSLDRDVPPASKDWMLSAFSSASYKIAAKDLKASKMTFVGYL